MGCQNYLMLGLVFAPNYENGNVGNEGFPTAEIYISMTSLSLVMGLFFFLSYFPGFCVSFHLT